MGKALIIKGADFSANSIGKVVSDIDYTEKFTFTDNLNINANEIDPFFGQTSESQMGAASNFVNILGASSIKMKFINYPVNGNGTGGVVFYTSDKIPIVQRGYFRESDDFSMVEKKIDVPSNAAWVRVTILKGHNSEFSCYVY